MKKHIIILFLLICAGCFISCEKEVDFKGKITEPLLVMNSVLTPDLVVSIHLSQSRFILGDLKPITDISGAKVSLFVNGDEKEQLTYKTNGIYMGTYLPKPGDKIKIEAVAEGFDPISSQTVIPQSPNIVVSDSIFSIIETEYSNPMQPNTVNIYKFRNLQLQLKLTDAHDEENYYFIKGTQNYYQSGKLVRNRVLEIELSEVLKNNITDSGNILEDIIGDGGFADRTENLFTDLYVNGKDIFFDLSFEEYIGYDTYVNGEKIENSTNTKKDETVEYIIEIGEISKDMYQYIVSGNKATNTEDGGFSEPVQVHTNIENGIGILGAYNTYRFVSRFEMDDYNGD